MTFGILQPWYVYPIAPYTCPNQTQAWDLFEQGHLFNARDADKHESESHHLAEMTAYLGPPPREMLAKSDYASNFFDTDGNLPSTYCSSHFITFPRASNSVMQGTGKASLKSPLDPWKIWRETSKESSKQVFSVSCAGCFDGGQKRDPRRKSCYQILG